MDTVIASVLEERPNGHYLLKLPDGREALAYLAGRMRLNRIRVMVGDRVWVKLDPYEGKTTNRIFKRL